MVLKGGGAPMAVVYTGFKVIGPLGEIMHSAERPLVRGWVLPQLASGNFIGNGSSPLMRKTAVLQVGGYDPSLRERKAQGCEDWLLY
jgi:hypothetical protein